MNKWYRLGQEFAKKFDDKNVYDYLKKNNLCNNFTDSQGKDFKEKDYKKLCEMVGIPEEAEDKHYSHGENIISTGDLTKKKQNKEQMLLL